jgi:hypothetical protein
MIGFLGHLGAPSGSHGSGACHTFCYPMAALGFSGNNSNVSSLMFPL